MNYCEKRYANQVTKASFPSALSFAKDWIKDRIRKPDALAKLEGFSGEDYKEAAYNFLADGPPITALCIAIEINFPGESLESGDFEEAVALKAIEDLYGC